MKLYQMMSLQENSGKTFVASLWVQLNLARLLEISELGGAVFPTSEVPG